MEGEKKVGFIDMFAILNTAQTLSGKLYVESVECDLQITQGYIKFEISFHPLMRKSANIFNPLFFCMCTN